VARREIKIEEYLAERVRFNGGECLKLDARGHRGRVDRIVAFPHHCTDEDCILKYVIFCEVKTATGVIEPHQRREHERLRKRGNAVRIIRSYEDVDQLVDEFCLH